MGINALFTFFNDFALSLGNLLSIGGGITLPF